MAAALISFGSFKFSGAVIKERPVPSAGVLVLEGLFGESENIFVGDVRLTFEKVMEIDAADVGVDEGGGGVESEATDGAGSVGADARVFLEFFGVRRKLAIVCCFDLLGGALQEAGAAPVAKARPGGEEVGLGGGSESGGGGELLKKLVVFRNDAGDLGLLEHDFGDEDGVGIASVTPR